VVSGKRLRALEAAQYPGGMRSPHKGLHATPHARVVGPRLAEALLSELADDPELYKPILAFRKGAVFPGFPPEKILAVRRRIMAVLGASRAECLEPLTPDVVLAYGRATGDSDAISNLHWWLRPEHGVPLGITKQIECCGVFPPSDRHDRRGEDPRLLYLQHSQSVNYSSAESDPVVMERILGEAVDAGHCLPFKDRAAAEAYLGTSDLVVQRMALVSKRRADGTTKHRIIWDFLRSGTSGVQTILERIVLPRQSDAVADRRELSCNMGDWSGFDRSLVARLHWLPHVLGREATDPLDAPEQVESMVLDFEAVFQQIFANPSERQFNVCTLNGRYYVFRVLLFGSVTSPGAWGRLAAFLGRSLAALFSDRLCRVQTYVDDPLFACRGSKSVRTNIFSAKILWLVIVGLPLSWAKAVAGLGLAWIGVRINWSANATCLEVPASKVTELRELLTELGRKKVVPIRHLRSVAGKLNFFAGIVIHMAPFIAILWAAITAVDAWGSRRTIDHRHSVVCVKRFRHALKWLICFFDGSIGSLKRSFPHRVPTALYENYIAMDASIWGGGAILVIDSRVTSWFVIEWSDADHTRDNLIKGDSGNMSFWESLTLLVAARVWLPAHQQVRRLRLKSDSLSALRLAVRLSSPSPAMNRIGCELALDLANDVYQFELCEHIAGITNTIPDILSRQFSPEAKPLPSDCDECKRIRVPPRDGTFWSVQCSQKEMG
jgi:hypothetical protein